ncbi:hypothetical protein NLJ89_g4551 [Agrocybe chaxingu]|uniref:Uncharacterized protein n=1 Tax=Agrocybe chaxingu TaxID=84603 RepID=A0A9W8K8L1_9AGAR|nr:hypothetical protein NLJ89_g4551 [Agrocybe chaxingu]
MHNVQPAPSSVILDGISPDMLDISWDRVTGVEILNGDLADCVDLLRSTHGLTCLILRAIEAEMSRFSGIESTTHRSLRSLKIDGMLDTLSLLTLPALQELFVEPFTYHVVGFIERSGCNLTWLTIKWESGYGLDDECVEEDIMSLLEHTPTLLELGLDAVPLSDAFFERLKPINRLYCSSSNEAQTGRFLPVLHTLVIRCIMKFPWASVCGLFDPAPPQHSLPTLKIFRLVLFPDTGQGDASYDCVSIPLCAAKFLVDARKVFKVQISVSDESSSILLRSSVRS